MDPCTWQTLSHHLHISLCASSTNLPDRIFAPVLITSSRFQSFTAPASSRCLMRTSTLSCYALFASCRRFLHCIDAADTKTRCPHPFRITATTTQFLRPSGGFLGEALSSLPLCESVEQARLWDRSQWFSKPLSFHIHVVVVFNRPEWPRYLGPRSVVHGSSISFLCAARSCSSAK